MSAYPLLLFPLLAWLLISALGCLGVLFYFLSARSERLTPSTAAVAVIIPIRGIPNTLASLWGALGDQTYRRWRLLLVVESVSDLAFQCLSLLLANSPLPVDTKILVAGRSRNETAQKVHNLLRGLSNTSDADDIIVFADADIVPSRDWLEQLIGPLNNPEMLASSGSRCLLPEDAAVATAVICAINFSIVTLPRPRWINLLWGGSMAVRRPTLQAFDIETQWHGVISDDLRLSQMIRAAHGAMLGPRRLLVASPACFSWVAAIEFARRQYALLRTYAPLHWTIAAFATTVPVLGWITGLLLIVDGDATATIFFAIAVLLHQFRAALRRRIAGLLGIRLGTLTPWLDAVMMPAVVLFHASLILSTSFPQSINWGDRVYQLKRRPAR